MTNLEVARQRFEHLCRHNKAGTQTDLGTHLHLTAEEVADFQQILAARDIDWAEDFAHENGNYMCVCSHCKQRFFGYKRRVVCKVCATERMEKIDVQATVQMCVAQTQRID